MSHTAVRSRPGRGCCASLALPDQLDPLTLGTTSVPCGLLGTPAGVVSEPSDDCCALLSRSLSGGELPLDYSNDYTAAAGAARAPCTAVRVSRSKRVNDVSGHGRVGGSARASIATGGAAAAAMARTGGPTAWLPVAAVPAVGDLGSCVPSAADFCVSHACTNESVYPMSCETEMFISFADGGASPSLRIA